MRITRALKIILCALLCMGVLPVTTLAQDTVSVWDGTSVATAYESGEGTETSPYEIATADQFAYFAQQIRSGKGTDAYYILSRDVDMTASSWNTIGTSFFSDYVNGYYFAGSFDGQGHTITYQISEMTRVPDYSAVGLFGFAEGAFSNLTVDGSVSEITSINGAWVGGLCGLFAGEMTNCVSDVDFTLTDTSVNSSSLGGIVSEFQGGTMKECLYTGNIQLSGIAYSDNYVGGVSAKLYAGQMNACKNEGNIAVTSETTNAIRAGGVVGLVYTYGEPVTSEMSDCYNTGSVRCTGAAGGIAGYVSAILDADKTGSAIARVYNCYSSGTTTGQPGQAIAGIVGSTNNAGDAGTAAAQVEQCYYTQGDDENGTLLSIGEMYDRLIEAAEAGVWLLDANGIPRLYWEFTVNATPEATFTATSENGGVLSGVDATMKYSVDGGKTWQDIAGTIVEITGATADDDIKVYRPGDDVTTLDSQIQTIDVTQAAQPTVSGVDCTIAGQSDGQITGVDATMEYRHSASSAWTPITGTEVTGLASGTYEVRVKASGTVLASAAATVTIGEASTGGQENATPEASFTATSENGGVLSGVDATMKYSVDGGKTWQDISGTIVEITGATADDDIKVYRPGDGVTALDSQIQTIDVTQATQPTVSGVDCTIAGQSDGQITGVDATMEYRHSASSAWTPITGTAVTGLPSGTYEVRVKASGTVLASAAATVTIGEAEEKALPKTGDTSNITFWTALLLISGAALAVTGACGRTRRRS